MVKLLHIFRVNSPLNLKKIQIEQYKDNNINIKILRFKMEIKVNNSI